MPTSERENGTVSSPRGFCTTRWTTILSAASEVEGESGEAWNQLAQAYWYPLYAYVRQVGYAQEDAGDLTQAFFAYLIESRALARLVPGKGRFRSYLLVCLKHFLVDHYRQRKSTLRSPSLPMVSLDLLDGEQRYQLEDRSAPSPETLYDRWWARSLLEKALARVKADYDQRGDARLFNELISHLTQDVDSVPHAELARRLGMTESAIKTAMFRLRKRLNEVFIAEVASTVAAPELEDELRDIYRILTT